MSSPGRLRHFASSARSTFNAVELNGIPEGHGITHPQNRLLKCVQTHGAGTLPPRIRPQLHQRLPRRLPDGDEVIHMAAVLVVEQTIDRWDRLIRMKVCQSTDCEHSDGRITIGQSLDECSHGLLASDLFERADSAEVDLGLFEQRNQCRNGSRVLELAEQHGRIVSVGRNLLLKMSLRWGGCTLRTDFTNIDQTLRVGPIRPVAQDGHEHVKTTRVAKACKYERRIRSHVAILHPQVRYQLWQNTSLVLSDQCSRNVVLLVEDIRSTEALEEFASGLGSSRIARNDLAG